MTVPIKALSYLRREILLMREGLRRAGPVASFALALLGNPAALAQAPNPMTHDVVESYEQGLPWADFVRREVMVPMRDGTKLHTVIVMKKGRQGRPHPALPDALRRPWCKHRVASQRIVDVLQAMDSEFAEDGYISVYQDIRDLYRSEDEYIINRLVLGPLNDTGIDESNDAYDTIGGLLKKILESDGDAGTIGSSHLGLFDLMAEIYPRPALKAVVAESPMIVGWIGDDWFQMARPSTSGYVAM
jgi:uncharacterized protein